MIPSTNNITEIIRFEKCSRVRTAKVISLLAHDITNLSIPQFVELDGEYCEIVAIGPAAFANNQTLTEVEIPDSVTTVEDYAFYGCTNIKTIHIPGVSKVGRAAFAGCAALELSIINFIFAEEAFRGCKSLSDIVVTEGSFVCTIPDASFKDSGLRTISLPESVHSIRMEAFAGAVNLKEFVFPSKLKLVESHAFYECKSLKKVKFNDCVERLDDYAFAKCRALTSVYIPDSVEFVGEEAFGGCNSLYRVRFSSNTPVISSRTFIWCKNLSSFENSYNIQAIKAEAFVQCQSLCYLELQKPVNVDDEAFDCCPVHVHTIRDESAFLEGDTELSIVTNSAGNAKTQKELEETQTELRAKFQELFGNIEKRE